MHKGVMASVSELIERESWMKDEVAVEVKEDVLQQLIDYAYTQMLGPFTRKSEVITFDLLYCNRTIRHLFNLYV